MTNYDRIAIIIFIFILIGAYAIADLDTSDIDAVPQCNTTNSTLKRNSTHWYCDTTHYAEMWGRDITNITIASQNVYVNVTGMNNSQTNGITYTGSKFTITKNAMYRTVAQISFSGGANNEYHLALAHNGTRDEHCHSERKLGTGGDVGSASFTCIDQLNNGDIMTLMVENTDSNKDMQIHSVNLNIMEIK